MMTSKSRKTTTAMLAVLSLMQPVPASTQVLKGANDNENGAMSDRKERRDRVEARSFEEICAEAMIAGPRACAALIRDLKAKAELKARAATDKAGQAAIEAKAAGKLAKETKGAEKGKAKAVAARLAREADVAAAQAKLATETAELLATQAQAAEQAADGEAQARAKAAAFAKAQVDAKAAADTTEQAQSEAQSEAEDMADAKAGTEAESVAGDQQTVEDTAAAESEQPAPAAGADDCPAQVIDADGTIRCVDALTSDAMAAIAVGSDAGTEEQAEVITETVTESKHRSSSEEFGHSDPVAETAGKEAGDGNATVAAKAQPDTGLSDLEKAGLIFLGAVAVGAILSNGQRVETNTGDRVIVQEDDGSFRVLKDDDALLRQPGSKVRTERFNDGSTRTTVTRADGTRIVTIRDSSGRALRRMRIEPDGREYLLIDDTRTFEPVTVEELPSPAQDAYDYREASDAESLRLALLAAERRDIGRSFSLRQVREYAKVRALAPVINLQSITFATNSAALQPSQAEQLRQMGLLMRELITKDPTELFLVEGHTDAMGSASYNLLLSDRRAESVALAFSEYFGVPAENMVVQGYGESFLRVPTQEAERVNRRVAVRRITRLLYRY